MTRQRFRRTIFGRWLHAAREPSPRAVALAMFSLGLFFVALTAVVRISIEQGHVLWVEVLTLAVRVAAVALIAFLVYLVAKRSHDAALEAQRRELVAERNLKDHQAFIQRLSDAVILQDADTRVISVNAAAEQLYGRPADDFLGTTFAERRRFYRWTNVTHEQAVQHIADHGFFRGEAELVRPDNQRRTIDGTVDALQDDDGNTIGYFSVIRDVTRRAEAEARANATSAKLIALLHASTEMLRAASIQEAADIVAEAVAASGWRSVLVFICDENLTPTHHARVGTNDEEADLLLKRAQDGDAHVLLSDRTAPFRVSRSYFIPHDDARRIFPDAKMVRTEDAPGDNPNRWRAFDIAFTPLTLVDGKTIGRICFARPADGKRPDEHTFAVIQNFADLAAQALERLRAQQRERELEDRARLLLESLSVVAWQYDAAQDRFTYVSPQTERLTGRPAAEWTDFASWVDMIHPDDREAAAAYCKNAAERGENHEFEYRLLHADGNPRWVREVVAVDSDHRGRPAHLRGVIVDVHEIKSAERDAVRSRAFLELAHKVARIGSWEVDFERNRIAWSEQVYTITGVHPDIGDITDPFVRSLVHPDDRRRHDDWYDALQRGEPGAVEITIMPADQTGPEPRIKRIRLQGDCELDDTGKPRRVFGSIQDLTPFHHAEAADRRARLLIESMPVVAYEFDPDEERFAFVSDTNASPLGQLSASWSTFQSWLDSIHPDDRAAARAWCREVLQTTGGETHYRVLLPSGSIRWVREIVRIETAPSGRKLVRGLFLDVQHLMEAEAANDRARLIIESTPLIVGEFDATANRFTYLSPQADRLFNGVATSWTDLDSWLATVHPDDRDDVRDWAHSVLSKPYPRTNIEYRLLTGADDGDARWVREVISLETLPNGSRNIRWVIIDIHALKVSERAARHAQTSAVESEAFLSMSQDLAHIGSWDWDARSGAVVWSHETYRIFGLDPDQHQSIHIDLVNERIHPDDRDAVAQWTNDAASERRVELPPLEHRVVRPDGEVRLTVALGRATYDHDGRLVRLFGTTQDITDLRRTEEAERVKSVLLDTVLSNTPGILWRVDRDGRFFQVRGMGLERFAIEDDHIVGENALDIFPEFAPAFRDALRGTASQYHSTGNYQGKQWHHIVHAFPDPEGDGVAGYSFDVTDHYEAQLRIEQALHTQRLLLEELDHRVKNTLGGLLTLVDLTEAESASTADFATRIRGRIKSMAVVHALLSESRWKSIDLQAMILAMIPPDAGGRVFTRGTAILVPAAQATPLAMILQEWLSNAMKHGALSVPGAGAVYIRWHAVHAAPNERRLTLEWTETGGPPVPSSTPEPGVGTRLVEGFARFELRGDVRFGYQTDGARHVLDVLLNEEARLRTRPAPTPSRSALQGATSSGNRSAEINTTMLPARRHHQRPLTEDPAAADPTRPAQAK